MRSRPTLPTLSDQVGKHLGVNGDHIAAIEYDEKKVRDVLGLPGYGAVLQGQANHDDELRLVDVGRRGNANDGKRFTLQEIYLSPLAHTLYDDGRDPSGEPSFCGLQKKQALAHLQQPHRDPRDGRGHPRRRVPRAASERQPRAPERRAGRGRAVQVRAVGAVGAACARRPTRRSASVVERARPRPLHEAERCAASTPRTRSAAAAWPTSKDLGVVDHRNEVFDNEGLFCIDSSAIPTSLGVNPSLTISAVSERAVAQLIDRAADYGLPAKPAGFAPGVPGVNLGPHTTPVRSRSDDEDRRQGPQLRLARATKTRPQACGGPSTTASRGAPAARRPLRCPRAR